MDADTFTMLALERAQTLWPHAEVEAVAQLHLRMVPTENAEPIDIPLDNFYATAAAGEVEAAAIDSFLRRMLDMRSAEGGPASLARLRPLIIEAAPNRSDEGFVRYPFAADLEIVLVTDEGDSVSFLGGGDLERMGVVPEDALRRAMENLASDAAAAHAGVQTDYKRGGLITIEPDDFYAAARLLLPSVQNALREAGGGTVLVGMPARDTVVALRESPEAEDQLRRLIAEVYEGGQSPLSPRLYRLSAAGLEAVLEPADETTEWPAKGPLPLLAGASIYFAVMLAGILMRPPDRREWWVFPAGAFGIALGWFLARLRDRRS